MISGILAVDKAAGWTSHDVVGRVRRLAGQKQVGHAGTLDPLATGILLVMLGTATRLSEYLMHTPKVYCAEVVLGAGTVTDDAEAPVRHLAETSHISRSNIESALLRFTGEIDQVPPQYAAVRQGGKKLYQLARQGLTVDVPPRRVSITEIELIDWTPPRLRLLIRCGSGTYIRSLARDIGAHLECGGYLHALRRVASGAFTIADCRTLDSLAPDGAVMRSLLPPDRAVLHWPAMFLTQVDVSRVTAGNSIPLGTAHEGRIRLYDSTGTLIALGEASGSAVKPFKVFSGGSSAG